MNVRTKFEFRSFTGSWDNRGYPQKIRQSLDMLMLPLLQNFSRALARMHPMNVPAKFEVRSFTRSRVNRGSPKIWGGPWVCPYSLYSPKNPICLSYKLFHSMCIRFPAIFVWSFGWGLWIPNLGEGHAAGGREGYHLKENWWVPISPLYILFL